MDDDEVDGEQKKKKKKRIGPGGPVDSMSQDSPGQRERCFAPDGDPDQSSLYWISLYWMCSDG
jgi:hypothetical protein